jgi:hypothetical protein
MYFFQLLLVSKAEKVCFLTIFLNIKYYIPVTLANTDLNKKDQAVNLLTWKFKRKSQNLPIQCEAEVD